MLIRLRIRPRPDGPFEDREFTLDALRIGRAPSADLVIPDDTAQTVSWQHARVDSSGDGILLHDLKSTNGTFLNGRRLEGSERLRVGDRIQLGQTGPTVEVVILEMHPPRIDPTYIQLHPAPPPMPAMRRAVATPPGRPGQMSATRALLIGMQKKQKIWMFAAGGALLFAGLVVGIVLWRHESRIDSLEEEVAKINARFLDEETDSDAVDSSKDSIDQATRDKYAQTHTLDDKVKSGRASGEVIYQRAVLSTAWVVTDQQDGTGSVIEHDGKRLIVTSYHVINGARKVGVIFPKFLNGKVLANHGQYLREGAGGSDSVVCNVWASDPNVDLAILEPAAIPEAIRPLPIAPSSVSAGADVHTVGGNASGTNALWSYSRGTVRQVAGPANLTLRSGQKVHATIVETQNPINHGDSGGPLVNKRCELVGVTLGDAGGAQLVSQVIDVSHVQEILRTRPKAPATRDPSVNPLPKTPPERPKTPPKVPPKSPDPVPSGGHIHVLLLVDDTDDLRPNGTRGIGEGVRRNEKRIRDMLNSGLPPGRTTIETFKGKQCNRNNIREYYGRLRAGPGDTIMCYYTGHGVTDKPTGAHYFSMNGGGWIDGHPHNVPRGEVRQLMKSSGGRLWVLISECCGNFALLGKSEPKNTTEFARGNYLVPLLLQQHGAVDIQAASPGECGYSFGNYCPFTNFLCEACESGVGDWDRVFQLTRDKTVGYTRPRLVGDPGAAKRGQRQQTPYKFPDMRVTRD